jgi:hypothetical protein
MFHGFVGPVYPFRLVICAGRLGRVSDWHGFSLIKDCPYLDCSCKVRTKAIMVWREGPIIRPQNLTYTKNASALGERVQGRRQVITDHLNPNVFTPPRNPERRKGPSIIGQFESIKAGASPPPQTAG